MADFKINPARAVSKALGKNCAINEANSLCYGVCAAFHGSPDAYSISKDCSQQCENLIEEMRLKTWGLPYCYHAGPWKPLIRDAPTFFPNLYKQTRDIKLSLRKCNELCENTQYPNECKRNCLIQSYAVEEGGNEESFRNSKNVNKEEDDGVDNTGSYFDSGNLWIILTIFCILVFFLYYSNSKKNVK